MDPDITKIYGNRVRLRVCGLCWDQERLLLVNHMGLSEGDFWSPPGGGIEFAESVHDNLVREFREETGLEVVPGRFLFVCEYLREPLHAVELFFSVTISGGKLITGADPELQIIRDARFFTPREMAALKPTELHGIFEMARTPEDFEKLGGFYRI